MEEALARMIPGVVVAGCSDVLCDDDSGNRREKNVALDGTCWWGFGGDGLNSDVKSGGFSVTGGIGAVRENIDVSGSGSPAALAMKI